MAVIRVIVMTFKCDAPARCSPLASPAPPAQAKKYETVDKFFEEHPLNFYRIGAC